MTRSADTAPATVDPVTTAAPDPDPQDVVEAPAYLAPDHDDPGDSITDPAHPDHVEPYAAATRPAGA